MTRAIMPAKGQRVRVEGCNEVGQGLASFQGVVLGVEFRTTPPVLSVRDDDGYRHDVTNIGCGARWELCA